MSDDSAAPKFPKWKVWIASIPVQLAIILPAVALARPGWIYFLVLVPLCFAVDLAIARFYINQVYARGRTPTKVFATIAFAGLALDVALGGLLYAVSAND